MMIKIAQFASECEGAVTWPDVAMAGVLAAGLVAVIWAVNR